MLLMKKRILFFIFSLKRGGGAEKAISLLTQELIKYFDVFTVTFYNTKRRYPVGGKYLSINENNGSKIGQLTNLLLRPFKIYRIIKNTHPDLIISNIDLTNIVMILTKILFRLKIPLVITLQTNPLIAYDTNMKYINTFIKFMYSLKVVDKILAVSNDIKNILTHYYRINTNKIIVVYNGIDTEQIRILREKSIKNEIFSQNFFLFITVGRLHPVKGQKSLIKAFKIVKQKVEHSKLIILGDGILRNDLLNLVRDFNLEEDVFLLGFKKNPYKYLYQSDVFVLSSLREGLPTVLIEAMACQLPIISTDCKTGPREILQNGENGVLVRVNDIESLANSMILLASEQNLLKKLKESGIKRAQRFDIKKTSQDWVNLINSLR